MKTPTDEKPTQDTPKPAASGDTVPADKDALFAYLRGRTYEGFAAKESKSHPSRGPHTRKGLPVRVFLNAALAGSLEKGGDAHPAGAAAIKEMFTKDDELRGWAVMVKTADESGDDGQGWYWYEVTSATDGSDIVAADNGLELCTDCHDSGTDMVLTDFPLN